MEVSFGWTGVRPSKGQRMLSGHVQRRDSGAEGGRVEIYG